MEFHRISNFPRNLAPSPNPMKVHVTQTQSRRSMEFHGTMNVSRNSEWHEIPRNSMELSDSHCKWRNSMERVVPKKTSVSRKIFLLILIGFLVVVLLRTSENHSVESPSMVDPQWNIWYWGSKRNLHTVCWSAVGCEWGTTCVYFGITYVCFIPSRLHVFAVEPQYLLQYFLFLSKVSFELHIQNLQKISCWFKIWMGFVGPILI